MNNFRMNATLISLRTRWAALSVSEQRMIRLGAAIVLPVLFYLLLWQPAHSGVDRLQQSVPQLRAQLAQMQAQAVEVQTLRHGARPAVLEGDALRRIVQGAVEAAGWGAPTVLVELADKNEIRVNAEGVAFARWVALLRELENTHHIRVSALTISASSAPGMVKVNAVINNGASE